MFSSQVLTKCLLPSLAAVAVEVKSKSKPTEEENECLIRPSELPLYSPEPPVILPPMDTSPQLDAIESAIRNIRLQLVKFNKEYEAYKKVGVQELNKTKEDLDWLVDYLQEENNTLPKVGAIGIGALTGLIFGLRGGFIKRTIYATIGAMGIGAVCYPKEAAKYGEVGLKEGRKYMVISYNFVSGVKKDDPPKDLPSLPPIPTSITEVWESIKATALPFISDEKSKSETEQASKSE